MKRLNEGSMVKFLDGGQEEIVYAGQPNRPMRDSMTIRLDLTYYVKENVYKNAKTGEPSDAFSFEISYDEEAITKAIKEAIEDRMSKAIGEKVISSGGTQSIGFPNYVQNWKP